MRRLLIDSANAEASVQALCFLKSSPRPRQLAKLSGPPILASGAGCRAPHLGCNVTNAMGQKYEYRLGPLLAHAPSKPKRSNFFLVLLDPRRNSSNKRFERIFDQMDIGDGPAIPEQEFARLMSYDHAKAALVVQVLLKEREKRLTPVRWVVVELSLVSAVACDATICFPHGVDQQLREFRCAPFPQSWTLAIDDRGSQQSNKQSLECGN